MLDIHLSSTIADDVWTRLTMHAALPVREQAYYQSCGPTAQAPESRRQYRRISCRGRAALHSGSDVYGIYLIDVSPLGTGFYSPVQTFPLERVRVVCDQQPALDVEIRRCVRVAENSYACGAKFIAGPMPPARYKAFLNSFRD